MTRPKVIRLAVALAVFTAMGLAANRLLAPEPVDDGPAAARTEEVRVPVTLAAPARERIERVLVLSGTIEPLRTVEVSATQGGAVERVLAEEGARVGKGQALLVLDARSLRLQVEQARADRDAARARLDELRRGARAEEVSQAVAARERAGKRVQTEGANLERARRLAGEGVVSASYLEQAETAFQDASAELTVAEDRLKILRDGATAEQLAAAEAALASAQARAGLAEKALEEATVASPVAGVVAERRIEPGEYLPAGRAAFLLHQAGAVKVAVAVPERFSGIVRPGQAAVVEGESGSGLGAVVTRVAPALDPVSRTLEAEIAIPGGAEGFRIGAFARVILVPEARDGALVVPVDAVVFTEDGDFLFVADGERAARRTVRTGIRSERAVEILEGVSDGERVVVGGSGRVRDGSLLAVVAP